MYASTPFAANLFRDLLGEFHSRSLLLHGPFNQSPSSADPLATPPNSHNSTDQCNFDSNVLSVLLCALVCSLWLISIVRCAFRCSNSVISDPASWTTNPPAAARLANKGIKKKALRTFPAVSYSTETKFPGMDTECAICLSEFTNGERLRIFPKCNHGFHIRCIDKWLSSHSSCPKCRQCLVHTCQKIVGSRQGGSTQPPPVLPRPETIVRTAPLEHIDLVRNREVSLA